MFWIQVISFTFSVLAAAIGAPIVSRFEFSGGSDIVRKMTLLHRYTFLAKAFFCIAMAAIVFVITRNYGYAAISGLLGALWIWLTFDILLNRMRKPKRPWDYLGLNDGDGRFWNSVFGKQSGKFKAAILLAAIITINIILWTQGVK